MVSSDVARYQESIRVADSIQLFCVPWDTAWSSQISTQNSPNRSRLVGMMQSATLLQRSCSGLQASTSAKQSIRTTKAAITVSGGARAGHTTHSQEPQLRRRLSQNAVAMDCEAALSCPWPRTLEASRVAPQRRGILSAAISALQQVRCVLQLH